MILGWSAHRTRCRGHCPPKSLLRTKDSVDGGFAAGWLNFLSQSMLTFVPGRGGIRRAGLGAFGRSSSSSCWRRSRACRMRVNNVWKNRSGQFLHVVTVGTNGGKFDETEELLLLVGACRLLSPRTDAPLLAPADRVVFQILVRCTCIITVWVNFALIKHKNISLFLLGVCVNVESATKFQILWLVYNFTVYGTMKISDLYIADKWDKAVLSSQDAIKKKSGMCNPRSCQSEFS